jgi:RNA methyltransferase, TrmH family
MNREIFSSFEKITSTKNPKIKNFRQLQKAGERKKQNLFIVEGRKEIDKALDAGYAIDQVFYCPDILEAAFLKMIIDKLRDHTRINDVSRQVYNHITYRNDVEGIIAWVVPRTHTLKEISLRKNPLILVLDGVEKPGNLGAMLRTADAAGLDAVILCNPQTDIYNPNVIRSSLGTVFTVPVGLATSHQTIAWLKDHQISIFCTSLDAAEPYVQLNFASPSAIVMGTEATGISNEWLEASDRNIIIPMYGQVDSLNVSVSAAIVIFEALRQRKK